MKRVILLFGIIIFSFINSYPQINFDTLTVNSNKIMALKYKGKGTFYISTEKYLLKTTNYFKTWDTLFTFPESNYRVTIDTNSSYPKLIVHPFSSEPGYHPEYISINDGKSWSLFNTIYFLNYTFINNDIYKAGYGHVYVSTDLGATWTDFSPSAQFKTCLSLGINSTKDFFYLNYGYFINDNGNYVYYGELNRKDAGSSQWNYITGFFEQQFPEPIAIQSADFVIISYLQNAIYYNKEKNSYFFTAVVPGSGKLLASADQLSNYYGIRGNTFSVSSVPGNWTSYTMNLTMASNSFIHPDFFLDDYGFAYVHNWFNNEVQEFTIRSTEPLYQYLNTTNVSFDSIGMNDTTYKSFTIHNPLNRVLALDSVSFSNPSFLIKTILPKTIPPGDSVIIALAFCPKNVSSYTSNATLHMEYLDLHLTMSGIGIVNDVKETLEINPNRFALYQNYPNPFNSSTVIKYKLNGSGTVSLKIFDYLGREVKTLLYEEKPAGEQAVLFSADDLSSGIYLYQLKTNSGIQTRKMILMK